MNSLPDISEIVRTIFATLIGRLEDLVPRVFGCLLILATGYLVAKGAGILVTQLLSKLGFDRIGDRLFRISIIRKLKTEVLLSALAGKVVYYYLLLIVFTLAAGQLGVDTITRLVLSLVGFIPRLIAGAILLQTGILLSDAMKTGVTALCKSFHIASSRLIGNIVFIFLLIITFITALDQIGMETTLLESTFTLFIGGVVAAFAIGYGIASRDVMANIIASTYGKKKYQEGQVIQVAGVRGIIIKIDTTSVTLATPTSTAIIPFQVFQASQVEIFE